MRINAQKVLDIRLSQNIPPIKIANEYYLIRDFKKAEMSGGIISSVYTGIRGLDKKSKNAIENYAADKVDLKTALKSVTGYKKAQENTLTVVAGLIAMLCANQACNSVADFASSEGIISVAGMIGNAVHSTVTFIDRLTNKIKDDEFNPKKILKSCISGSLCGILPQIKSLAAQNPQLLLTVTAAGMALNRLVKKKL